MQPNATFSLTYPNEPLTLAGYSVDPVMRTRKLPKLPENGDTKTAKTATPQKRGTHAKKDTLTPTPKANPTVALDKLSTNDRKIVEYIIEHTKATMDEMTSTGLQIHEIMGAMTLLEIQGIVKALPGGYYTLSEN